MSAPRVRPRVAAMAGYVPGEQPREGGCVKLNTNENPYAPSPQVFEAIRAEADAKLRLYPSPDARPLREKAAAVYGVPVESVLAGNGSDELLTILVRAFVPEGGRVGGVRPDYLLYETLADIQGATFAVADGWPDQPDPDAIAALGAPAVFLSSPTNPTGGQLAVSRVRAIAEALAKDGSLLVVDEAYADFAPETCLPLVGELQNLVVLRSFSKSFSLAGLRVGLAFAPPPIVAELMKVKDSYNLDRLAIAAATAALDELKWMRDNADRIVRTRARLAEALAARGFEVAPSEANFVMCRPSGTTAAELQRDLEGRKILVRHYDRDPIRAWLRISVGTDEQTDALLGAIDAHCLSGRRNR